MSPYLNLPSGCFWKTGVADCPPASFDIYKKKFDITPKTRIMTAGSCFAQHIANYMRAQGFSVLDAEPPPPGLRGDDARQFGYNLYSARYGNIYVVRQLLQLLKEAEGHGAPFDFVWSRDDRYFDAMRPSVEPYGLRSTVEVKTHREYHLHAVRELVRSADVFVFTLGLTEAWIHEEGTVYPTAPGTIAGQYDKDKHHFKNFTFNEIFNDLCAVREIMMAHRPEIKFLLTVSPVPLTATASGDHVLAATIYSKSVLRAVAGQMQKEFHNVDYFPSYEIVASHASRGRYFDSNLRTVNAKGVSSVMSVFFKEHQIKGLTDNPTEDKAAHYSIDVQPSSVTADRSGSIVCDDELLEAFSK